MGAFKWFQRRQSKKVRKLRKFRSLPLGEHDELRLVRKDGKSQTDTNCELPHSINVRNDEQYVNTQNDIDDSILECQTQNNMDDENPLTEAHRNLLQNNAVVNDIKAVLWDQLEYFGLSDYLRGPMVTIPREEYATFKYRIKDFLYFIHHFKIKSNPIDGDVINIDSSKLLRQFILHDFMLLPQYCLYLKDVCTHRPFTIRNYLDHLYKFIEWFVLYRVGTFKRIRTHQLDKIRKLIITIKKKNNKEIKMSLADNTIEALTEKGRWPKGGLKELQSAIENEISWVNKLQGSITTPSAYNRFMQLLASAAYCFSPQGRCSAFEDLKYGQRSVLLSDKYVLSSKFKTRSKFGYQPITSNKVFEKLLLFYIDYIRPKRLLDDDDPMFINFAGSKSYKIRQSVPKFFMRTLNLKINTTTIRSIVETTMHKLQVFYLYFN